MKLIVTILVAATVIFSVVIAEEELTRPPVEVLEHKMVSLAYSYWPYSNGTVSPVYFNETGNGFKVTIEARAGAPTVILGSSTQLYSTIAYYHKHMTFPYTNVTFQISKANFSVSNYKMNMWNFFVYRNYAWLNFCVGRGVMVLHNREFYSGIGNVTIVPVVYAGPFHFGEHPFNIRFSTPPSWYNTNISSSPV